jgi:hypothetical protein
MNKYVSLSDKAFWIIRGALEDAGFFILEEGDEEIQSLADFISSDSRNAEVDFSEKVSDGDVGAGDV